jgi:hypothetical protein
MSLAGGFDNMVRIDRKNPAILELRGRCAD